MAVSKKVKEVIEKAVKPVVIEESKLETSFEVDKVAMKHEVKVDSLLVPVNENITVSYEEKTEQQKIMDYVANSHSQVVELSPILRSLYPLPTYGEPAIYLRQNESKRLMALLSSMKTDYSIVLADDAYLKLGKPYWIDGDTKTRHYNIDTVKILAIKK